MRRAAASLVPFLLALRAHADTSSVTVTLTPAGEQLAASFGDSIAALIQKVHDKIDDVYQTAHVAALLGAVMTTTAFANRSLGVDYQTRVGELEVGTVVTGTQANDVPLTTDHVIAGSILNAGLVVGANLAKWQHPRWSAFANAGYLQGSLQGLGGHLFSLGGHAQYKLVPPAESSHAIWIGVDVTSGLELARWSLDNGNGEAVIGKFTVQGTTAGESRNLTLTSTGTLSLVATTVTLPVEVTTGVRVFDAIGLYVGTGLDLTLGGSTLTAALDGDLTITQDATNVGHVNITASGDQSASPITVHAFGGIQFDILHFHMFAQGLVAPSVYGLSFGVRVSL